VTTQQTFTLALQHHQAGRLADALGVDNPTIEE